MMTCEGDFLTGSCVDIDMPISLISIQGRNAAGVPQCINTFIYFEKLVRFATSHRI